MLELKSRAGEARSRVQSIPCIFPGGHGQREWLAVMLAVLQGSELQIRGFRPLYLSDASSIMEGAPRAFLTKQDFL